MFDTIKMHFKPWNDLVWTRPQKRKWSTLFQGPDRHENPDRIVALTWSWCRAWWGWCSCSFQLSCCLRLHSPIQLITSEIICQEKIQNNSLTTWYTRGFLISFLEPSPGPNSRPETIFFKELSKLSSAVFGCYFHLERDLLWQRS